MRISAAGAVRWTKTLSAPTLYLSTWMWTRAITCTSTWASPPANWMLVRPQTTLVNPGKVYAVHQQQPVLWGFSIENTTDLSGDYSAIGVDDLKPASTSWATSAKAPTISMRSPVAVYDGVWRLHHRTTIALPVPMALWCSRMCAVVQWVHQRAGTLM
ncbi:MAG: hypothetical protein IPO90_09965 [Flavobacteriales bacterium]|nr:hypothetical protein [Flavobacteriales bacterium]